MAPPKKSSKSSTVKKTGGASDGPPKPFKRAPEALEPFTKSGLSPNHVYITHIDSKPRAFKQKIFSVPLALNVVLVLLFIWRIKYIAPYYWALVLSALGHSNETTVIASEASYTQIAKIILRRGFTFILDFTLVVFVWPWPVEFCFGRTHASPMQWRWNVGFRDKEIYVRRSRAWGEKLGDILDPANTSAKDLFNHYVEQATSPLYLGEKTGYLTMNGEWDLDWAAMILATKLVDKKDVALDAFKLLVLFHHKEHGWVSLDLKEAENAQDVDRRTQIFAFREALSAIGKEDLFFRWIEIVQFESSQPGGFGPEKQVEVAKQIRELFAAQGIDFDEFWKSTVDPSAELS